MARDEEFGIVPKIIGPIICVVSLATLKILFSDMRMAHADGASGEPVKAIYLGISISGALLIFGLFLCWRGWFKKN